MPIAYLTFLRVISPTTLVPPRMDDLHGLGVREVLPLGQLDPGVDDPQPRLQMRCGLLQFLYIHSAPVPQAPCLGRLREKHKFSKLPYLVELISFVMSKKLPVQRSAA